MDGFVREKDKKKWRIVSLILTVLGVGWLGTCPASRSQEWTLFFLVAGSKPSVDPYWAAAINHTDGGGGGWRKNFMLMLRCVQKGSLHVWPPRGRNCPAENFPFNRVRSSIMGNKAFVEASQRMNRVDKTANFHSMIMTKSIFVGSIQNIHFCLTYKKRREKVTSREWEVKYSAVRSKHPSTSTLVCMHTYARTYELMEIFIARNSSFLLFFWALASEKDWWLQLDTRIFLLLGGHRNLEMAKKYENIAPSSAVIS